MEGEPPDRLLFNNGYPYHHPAQQWSVGALAIFYENCGVFTCHERCLRCGDVEDEEHRLNWLECEGQCMCCGADKKGPKLKHPGKYCPQMKMTYAHFFTPQFFGAHAGVPSQPWASDFEKSYNQLRDSHPGGRGRKQSRHDEGRSKSKTHKDKADKSRRRYDSSSSSRSERPKKSKSKKHHRDSSSSPGRRKKSKSKKHSRDSSSSPERRKKSKSKKHRHDSSSSPERSKRAKVLCHECDKEGHVARHCPKRQCHLCQEKGHIARDCPTKDTCNNCGHSGHWAENCPDRGKCFKCHQRGHHADDCRSKKARASRSPSPRKQAGVAKPKTLSSAAKARLSKQKKPPVDLMDVDKVLEALQPVGAEDSSLAKENEELRDRVRNLEHRAMELIQTLEAEKQARKAAEEQSKKAQKKAQKKKSGDGPIRSDDEDIIPFSDLESDSEKKDEGEEASKGTDAAMGVGGGMGGFIDQASKDNFML